VQQHLGRQDGVQKVEVSLLDGKVQVTLKEDGRVDPARLIKAVYDSGVTVAEMDMIARGHVVKDSSGGIVLQTQPNQSFTIVPNDLSKSLESLAGAPAEVTVRGELYKKSAGKKKPDPNAPLRLLILEVVKKDP